MLVPDKCVCFFSSLWSWSWENPAASPFKLIIALTINVFVALLRHVRGNNTKRNDKYQICGQLDASWQRTQKHVTMINIETNEAGISGTIRIQFPHRCTSTGLCEGRLIISTSYLSNFWFLLSVKTFFHHVSQNSYIFFISWHVWK